MYVPCFEVAEFFGNHFANVDAQPIDDPLGQIWVRGAAEHLDVRHSALKEAKRTRLL